MHFLPKDKKQFLVIINSRPILKLETKTTSLVKSSNPYIKTNSNFGYLASGGAEKLPGKDKSIPKPRS